MSMSDAIADMLTRIRNGQKSRLLTTQLPASNMKIAILEVLKNEGYIKGYNIANDGNKKYLEVMLKYSAKGDPTIIEIQRVSKPSRRVYSQIDKLKGFYNNMGIYILSTSKGIISDRQAHNLGVGGEIICKVF